MATDTPIPNVGVILTHNRPELLAQCLTSAGAQFDHLFVIDNASEPPVELAEVSRAAGEPPGRITAIIKVPDQPPNISRMWAQALGLVRVEMHRQEIRAWNVALVCDDVILPDGWVQLVAAGLREHNAAAACTHAINPIPAPLVKTAPDSDIMNRITGWAFMLAGELGPQPDPGLEWWWGDTHLDWQARGKGGMVILPGPVVINERPNEYTVGRPELGHRAGLDGKAFEQIWGWRPW